MRAVFPSKDLGLSSSSCSTTSSVASSSIQTNEDDLGNDIVVDDIDDGRVLQEGDNNDDNGIAHTGHVVASTIASPVPSSLLLPRFQSPVRNIFVVNDTAASSLEQQPQGNTILVWWCNVYF